MRLLRLWFYLACLVSAFVTGGLAQPPPQTFFPASVPLAIRSPYMSIWYSSSNGSPPPSNSWPSFWGRGSQAVMDLQGSVRVDNKTYIWTGEDYPSLGGFAANLTNIQITPTRTIFTLQAGPMNVTITYLSPIEPSDWVLQSFPFSYVSFEAISLDGHPHAVEVYSELTGEWLSNDWENSAIRWTQYSTNSAVSHIQLQKPEKYSEINAQSQDGEAYFAMASRPALTWQIDGNYNPRKQFHNTGVLTNSSSTAFGPIAPNYVVFGISVDLGQIQSTSSPLAWAFGVVRNPSIGYTSTDKTTQDLSPYYVTRYPGSSDMIHAIDDFTADFSEAQNRAIALDNAILGNASNISTQYTDLVSLAVRQTLGSLDFTVSTGTDGKPNASDVRIFMKDISSPTPTGRVNPVEKMYGALPLLLYLNASIVGPLLAPLLDAQDSTMGQPSAAQDLGPAYPNATGATWGANLDVEQSGNMLIMLYAHARFSGDGTLIHKHYNLAKRWTDYLVNNTLSPSSVQITADSETGSIYNMTNLALKGIIGVKSMAEMSRALGEQADAQLYDGHADAMAASWHSLALSSDESHFLGVYGEQQSWALMYNIYADRLLDTGIVNQTVLQGQTAFYKNLLSSQSSPNFGLPIYSASSATNAAWILFTAAIVTDDRVRDSLIRDVWNRASFNQTQGPFPESYDTKTGAAASDSRLIDATPSFGAMFALLALSVPNTTITVSPLQSGGNQSGGSPTSSGGQGASDDGHKASVGAIVGGVVGGTAVALLFCATVYLVRRKIFRRGMEDRHRPSLPSLFPETHLSTNDLDISGPLTSPPAFSPGGGAVTLATKSGGPPLPAEPYLSPSSAGRMRMPSTIWTARGAPPSSVWPASRNSSSGYTNEVAGLRVEIENLRQAMQVMNTAAERGADAPPEYVG